MNVTASEITGNSIVFKQIITVNTLRPRQNGRHFPDDIYKSIFLNENAQISIKFSLKFVPRGPINNIPALVQIMAWRRLSDKPLSEPMMTSVLTHLCVTRPQWVKRTAKVPLLAPCRWGMITGEFLHIGAVMRKAFPCDNIFMQWVGNETDWCPGSMQRQAINSDGKQCWINVPYIEETDLSLATPLYCYLLWNLII